MRTSPKRSGWYRKKSYAHFDQPLDFDAAHGRVTDRSYVAKRSFWPFISFEDKKRRFRKVGDKKNVDIKVRPLKYCSHQDGYIFSYYAYMLQGCYESALIRSNLGAVVIGYRAGIGSNVDLSAAVFSEIAQRRKCTVICLDIKSFFDNIDHSVLKKNLKEVLGVEQLPADWFAVFKAMTKYAEVDLTVLSRALGFEYRKTPKPLCDASVYRAKVRGGGLVSRNSKNYGIPQGSAISAVFSNIYMLDFDRTVSAYVAKRKGVYRRYSDDILVVCRPSDAKKVLMHIDRTLVMLGKKISISAEKTEISNFARKGAEIKCDKPVTYLGFTFDGRKTQLRDRTLSRFYRRVTYATRRASTIAKRKGNPVVYKRQIYSDFSHLGKKNFYSYARRAAAIFNDPTPVKQLRNHMKIIDRKIKHKGR